MGSRSTNASKQRRIRLWLAGAAVALAAAGGGLFFALHDGTFHATGTFTLIGGAYPDDRNSCSGGGGYDDIANGAAVTIYGASGAVVGVGQLRDGVYRDYSCVFRVDVPEVQSGEDFYQIEVSHRGKISVSEDDAANGRIALSLGEYS